MHLASKEVFAPTPATPGVSHAASFYTQKTGVEKIRRTAVETRSDLLDATLDSYSSDNGKTWGPTKPLIVWEKIGKGSIRRFIMPGYVDPVGGQLLTMILEANMPSDDAVEDGIRNYFLRYQVSLDGGRTNAVDEVCVQHGPEYSAKKPFRGITVGQNAMMIGDAGSAPIRTRSGKILVPIQINPIGPDGQPENPGGGYTYHHAGVLIGTWQSDHRLQWDLSDYVANDPARSTRGCIEPTLAQFPDGRILMVLRGSNGGRKDEQCLLPSYRWYTVSHDDGKTWAPVQPWAYSDGTTFFSPSSMSQLITHSNGNIYWLGNISKTNCRANSPRYPLVIGRVDPATLLLMRDSAFVIDDKCRDENAVLTLSNFFAHEDRVTGEVLLHMSRLFMIDPWRGDSYLYRVQV
jgi:hypothetical protein